MKLIAGRFVARVVFWYALALMIAPVVYCCFELQRYTTNEKLITVASIVIVGVLLASFLLFPIFVLPFVVWFVVVQWWTTLDRSRVALIFGTALVSALTVVLVHTYVAICFGAGPVALDLLVARVIVPVPHRFTNVLSGSGPSADWWLRAVFNGSEAMGEWLALWIGMMVPRLVVPTLAPGALVAARSPGSDSSASPES